MYAIVATGGKQLKVAAGDVVSVEKLDAAVGDSVKFDVIFLADDGEVTVDTDALAAATVTAEVVEHYKGAKAIVFKFKKRKGYKRTKGHRQELTRVRITDVMAGEAPKKAAAKKPAVKKATEGDEAPKKTAAKKAAPKKTEAVAEATTAEAPTADAPEVASQDTPTTESEA